MPQIVTLKLDGDRLTDEDRALIVQGKCFQLTGYGLPHMTRCEKPLTPEQIADGIICCAEHDQQSAEDFQSVLRLHADDRPRVKGYPS